MPTTQQIKCIRGLLAKTGNQGNKETIVEGFTAGRSIHISDLTQEETKGLIDHLQSLDPNKAAIDKMKGKILYFAHEMGMTKKNKQNKTVADLKKVDAWMLKYSYLHKKLDLYSYPELPKLVSQFEQVYKHFLKAL